MRFWIRWTCPVTFHCDRIANCDVGPVCGLSDIGQCCSSGTAVFCCTSGTIKVRRYPCTCTGELCSSECVNSTDVRFACS